MSSCPPDTPNDPVARRLPGLDAPPEQHPRVYRHADCGGETQMPADVQANYLADPCFYGSETICATCGGPVEDDECTWVETGEGVRAYMNRLAEEKSSLYHLARYLGPFVCGFLAMLWVVHDPLGWYDATKLHPQADKMFFGMGFVAGFWVAPYPRLLLCHLGLL